MRLATPEDYETAARSLRNVGGVLAVDVLENDKRTVGTVVELTVGPDFDRVPPRILRKLAKQDLSVYAVHQRPDHVVVLAV